MEHFPFSPETRSSHLASKSNSLGYYGKKGEERSFNRQLDKYNKYDNRKCPKDLFRSWLQRYENFFVTGTVSSFIVINVLIKFIIGDSIQNQDTPEPSRPGCIVTFKNCGKKLNKNVPPDELEIYELFKKVFWTL